MFFEKIFDLELGPGFIIVPNQMGGQNEVL